MTTITLNNDIREFARRSPVALLTLIGMYAATGRVNNLSIETLEEGVEKALAAGINTPKMKRDDFESDQAYNDQANQLEIIRALSTKLNYGFTADTIPAMVVEMYDRMECHEEVWEAHTQLSESVRRLEDAFMEKARAELH
ncbi:hypothetical protein pEaSNUABM29_00013 [Erwinia phage pEa_SNUABM_29]|nr:hypothetical protein pEaSNUABM29_00013 [Erwinia phage pEa_SNUABM_29]